MSIVSHKFCWAVAVAGWVTGALLTAHAQQSEAGQSVVASDPTDPELAAKLRDIGASAQPAHALPEDQDQPLNFGKGYDRQGRVQPRQTFNAPPPMINSKQARKLLDSQKNWVFKTEKDYSSEKTLEEAIGVPGFEDQDGESTLLERFYQGKNKDKKSARDKDKKDKKDKNRSQATEDQDEASADANNDTEGDAKDEKGDKKKTEDPNSKKAITAKYLGTDTFLSPFAEKTVSWGFAELLGLDKPDADKSAGFNSDEKKDLGNTVAAMYEAAAPLKNMGDANSGGLSDFLKAPPSQPSPPVAVPMSFGAQPAAVDTFSPTRSLPDNSPVGIGESRPIITPSYQPASLRIVVPPPPTFTVPKRGF